MQTVKSKKFG